MESQASFGEAGGVTFAEGAHHVLTAVTVPLSGFEPVPLDARREQLFKRVEITAAPSIEPVLREGEAGATARHASKIYARARQRIILSVGYSVL
jgi:hypothetical protein